jgi:hypothetical protein
MNFDFFWKMIIFWPSTRSFSIFDIFDLKLGEKTIKSQYSESARPALLNYAEINKNKFLLRFCIWCTLLHNQFVSISAFFSFSPRLWHSMFFIRSRYVKYIEKNNFFIKYLFLSALQHFHILLEQKMFLINQGISIPKFRFLKLKITRLFLWRALFLIRTD